MNNSKKGNSVNASANILCVGLGWFPTTPGGMDRYGYELMHLLQQAIGSTYAAWVCPQLAPIRQSS